jgi:Family of unknown function (DUF6292)
MTAPELGYHDAHGPYIDAVLNELEKAGLRSVDSFADWNDPRGGSIGIAPDCCGQEFSRYAEVWLGWTEETGWAVVPHTDEASAACVEYAWIGVLPEPGEVAGWARQVLLGGSDESPGELKRQPSPRWLTPRYYRYYDEDDGDGFEEQLAAYATHPRTPRGESQRPGAHCP